jgi:hypothetical protein
MGFHQDTLWITSLQFKGTPMRLSFLPPTEPVSPLSRQHPAYVARDSKHREYTRNL